MTDTRSRHVSPTAGAGEGDLAERPRRVFICLEIPPDRQQQIEALTSSLLLRTPAIRRVQAHLLHITMFFCGNLDWADIDRVDRAAATAAGGAGPFVLTTDILGAFPPHGPARVVWLGLHDGVDEAGRLHRSLIGALRAEGFEVGGRADFSPHITLGRVRQGVRGDDLFRITASIARARRIGPVRIPVNHLTVMESLSGQSGPTYLPISRYPLT